MISEGMDRESRLQLVIIYRSNGLDLLHYAVYFIPGLGKRHARTETNFHGLLDQENLRVTSKLLMELAEFSKNSPRVR